MQIELSSLEIIKCLSCEASISTSIHMIEEINPLNAFLLARGNFIIEERVRISYDPVDQYCSYQRMYCKICRYPIGKYYRATSSSLQMLLNGYLLSKDSIVLEKKPINSKQRCSLFPSESENVQEKKIVEVEIKNYNPLLIPITDETNELAELESIQDALKLAEKYSAKFGNSLLKLEKRMSRVETICQANYDKVAKIYEKKKVVKVRRKNDLNSKERLLP